MLVWSAHTHTHTVGCEAVPWPAGGAIRVTVGCGTVPWPAGGAIRVIGQLRSSVYSVSLPCAPTRGKTLMIVRQRQTSASVCVCLCVNRRVFVFILCYDLTVCVCVCVCVCIIYSTTEIKTECLFPMMPQCFLMQKPPFPVPVRDP